MRLAESSLSGCGHSLLARIKHAAALSAFEEKRKLKVKWSKNVKPEYAADQKRSWHFR